MRPINKLLLFLAIFIIHIPWINAKTGFNILLVHAKNPSVPSSVEVRKGFAKTLKKANIDYTIHEDFIRQGLEDLPGYNDFMQALFEEKVSSINPDLIIVNGYTTLQCFLNFRSDELSKRNIIFTAIPTFSGKIKKSYPNSTAIIDAFPLKENIDLALRMHPELERIIFVGSTSKPENKYRIPMVNVLEHEYSHRVEFVKFFDVHINEIYADLIQSDTKDAIIELKNFTNGDGSEIYADEFYPYLHKHKNIPVYSFWPVRRDYKVLGGLFFSDERKGENTARIAIDFFNGKKLQDIPTQTLLSSDCSFYYQNLGIYNINEELLPKEALLLNKPQKLNKFQIKILFLSTLLFLILVTIVIYLLHNIKQRKESARQLQQSVFEINEVKEEALKAKEEALRANKVKSLFLANMTHELRTPLNSITGFSDVLVRRKNLDEYSYEKVKLISKNARNLLDLINNILDLSSIEAGKINIVEKAFNLHNLLYEIRELFELSAEEKNIYFEITNPLELPEFIIADEVRIRQILINLIGNAIKFTNKGYVKLSIQCFYKAKSEHLEFLKFSIEDTGIGIHSKAQKNIFESFTQPDSSEHDNTKGTGLGLAISKRLAEHMNASLTVRSERGRGSTFIFKLEDIEIPALTINHKEERDQKQLLYSQPNSLTASKILIVDDNKINHEIMREFLDHKALSLYFAQNGEEGIEIASREEPDIIFMDLGMPVMSGKDACKALKKNQKTRNIPIILLTASENEAIDLVEEFNLQGMLNKPVKYEDLIFTIKVHLFN